MWGKCRSVVRAPLLEGYRICLCLEKTGLLRTTDQLACCACHLCNLKSLSHLVPPGSYFGLWGGMGRVLSAPFSLSPVCVFSQSFSALGPAGPKSPSQAGPLPGRGSVQVACGVLSLTRSNTSLQHPENLLEHLEEGVLSSSACRS